MKATGTKILEVNPSSLDISEIKILRSLQIPVDNADDYLLGLIRMLKEKSLAICRPLASFSWYDQPVFNTDLCELTVNGSTFSLGKIITHALKRSSHIVLFVGTCGSEVEQLSKKYAGEGHGLESLILDIIGSEIAEELAEMLHQNIGRSAKESGYQHTNRYSPGYCGWPVPDQQKLFPLLEEKCGVRITPSSLMLPIKSVSGMVGIGPDVRFQGYSCAKCDAGFCIYRDKK